MAHDREKSAVAFTGEWPPYLQFWDLSWCDLHEPGMADAGMLLSHENAMGTCRIHTKHEHTSYLHAAGSADAGMRNVAISADLVGGVNNHHAPVVRL